jgi:5-methyltetrahydrofolate--homocysteine methyltransferase
LIYDRRREGHDPLQRLMQLTEGTTLESKKQRELPSDVFERLRWRIVEGAKVGLVEDLELARQSKKPLAIINEDLLAGMARVGELFGKGEMQLPFVLQSAETMKLAVAHLEPFLERVSGSTRGKIVLATVRGDVHDIGKNLVDIILTNNGYTVFNLGIKQPIERILEVAQEHRPDAIGMSGLLVKSTVVMRENLEEMNRRGVTIPVILGGAALTRTYVEADCRAIYQGPLYYAEDAFEGLAVMERLGSGAVKPEARLRTSESKSAAQRSLEALAELEREKRNGHRVQAELAGVERARIRRDIVYPGAPFLGPRRVEGIALQTVLPYVNETTLFQFQWGYRRKGKSTREHERFVAEEVRPLYHALAKRCADERILVPAAAYGFWRCVPEGNTLVLLDPASESKEIARFTFPRQKGKKHLCISDFFRSDGTPDVIALQVVTVGQRASDVAREWFAADRYQDYLHLHGLSVELAEGLAEYIHRQIRAELGIAADDAREMRELFKQGYRGSRYSFGYPACPNLADQEQLLALLGANDLGITLSEEHQLWPEQSTSAIVCHHPEAKYFTI